MVGVVGHNYQEHKIGVFDGAAGLINFGQNLLVVVVLDALGEGLEQVLLVVRSLVGHLADVGVLNGNIQTLLV